jgi:hypothetical protein
MSGVRPYLGPLRWRALSPPPCLLVPADGGVQGTSIVRAPRGRWNPNPLLFMYGYLHRAQVEALLREEQFTPVGRHILNLYRQQGGRAMESQ